MSNYKFKLLIHPKDIYDNLIPEQKKLLNNVQITKATLLDNGAVEIDCLALESEVIESSYLQVLSFDDKYLTAKDI